MRKLSWMLLLLLTASLWAADGDEVENQEPVLEEKIGLGEGWIGDDADPGGFVSRWGITLMKGVMMAGSCQYTE